MKKLLIASLTMLAVAACGPKIYTSDQFAGALTKHKTVAILPAEVSIQLRPNEAKRLTPEQIIDMAQKTGFDVQDKMHGWFLRQSGKFDYTVSFQDVNRTNSKLKDANIAYNDLKTKDRAEIAKLLGVDAVIQSRLKMEKPMSEGAAIAVGVLLGTWGSTNNVQTTININDGKSGDILWKYDYQATGSVGSSTTRLVDALMRNASRKFPYKHDK
jgi:hypothetical protein